MLKLRKRINMWMNVQLDVPILYPCFSVDGLVGTEATC